MRIKPKQFITPDGNIYDFKKIHSITCIYYENSSCYFRIKYIGIDDIILKWNYNHYSLTPEETINLVKEYRQELINAWTNSNIFKPKTNLDEYKRKK